MVQCDQSDGLFHGGCIGVTTCTQEVGDLDKYICSSSMGDGSQIWCFLLSGSYSSDEETRFPSGKWANECQSQEENIRQEPPEEAPRQPRGIQRRMKGIAAHQAEALRSLGALYQAVRATAGR